MRLKRSTCPSQSVPFPYCIEMALRRHIARGFTPTYGRQPAFSAKPFRVPLYPLLPPSRRREAARGVAE